MKTFFLSLFLFLFTMFYAEAQSLSGIAIYQSSSSFDMKMDSSQVTPERQERFRKMMQSQMQKEYKLEFTSSESMFKVVEKLDKGSGPGSRGPGMMGMMGGANGNIYKNLNDESMIQETEFFGKVFLITDTVPTLNWKLGKETKKIGSYTCYKATVEEKKIMLTIKNNGDGKGMQRIKDTVVREVVAWYTPIVPVSNGPDKYGGLPGLIMELQSGNTVWLCSRIEINPAEELEISRPGKGEEVTQAEYEEIAEKKIQEMQKTYGGGRDGRGNRKFEMVIGG